MKEVTYNEYANDLQKFVEKHSKKSDYRVITSPFENGEYHKNWIFEDGSEFIEINKMNHEEQIEVEMHKTSIKVTVKMVKHEYWSTDDSTSKYWYEKA